MTLSPSDIIGTMGSHRGWGLFVILTVCLISLTQHCNGGNVLVFPVDGSHWINMKIVLEELHARGHSLTVIRAANTLFIPEKSDIYTSITIDLGEDVNNFFEVYLQEHMRVCDYGFNVFISVWCIVSRAAVKGGSFSSLIPRALNSHQDLYFLLSASTF